jgi:hypothetical protein
MKHDFGAARLDDKMKRLAGVGSSHAVRSSKAQPRSLLIVLIE